MTRNLTALFAPYPTHITVTDLGQLLGVTMKTVYEYLTHGDIPAYRIGKKWIILRDDVRDFLDNSSIFTKSVLDDFSDAKSDLPISADPLSKHEEVLVQPRQQVFAATGGSL